MGFRGSSSSQASQYKLQGHTDENLFSDLIGGSVKTDSKTGKTDVIDAQNKKYTVKGASKKWQIFLYGYERFKNDKDFQNMDGLGKLFMESLDCFPNEYEKYLTDKNICKKLLVEYIHRNPQEKALKNIDKLKELLPQSNLYFNSKLKLKETTEKIKNKLKNEENRKSFLDKAIFNMDEVDRMSIKKGNFFLVFEKSDVLDIFTENFVVENSVAGNIKTDLNIDGQKVLMKYGTNVVELEVRNDSPIHYRQIRFNMLKERALALLENNTKLIDKKGERIFFFGKK